MPTFERPFTLLVQIAVERGRFLIKFLAVLEAFHDLPLGTSSTCLLSRWRFRRVVGLLRGTFRAQTVCFHAAIGIAGTLIVFYFDLDTLRALFLFHFLVSPNARMLISLSASDLLTPETSEYKVVVIFYFLF